MNQGGHAIEVTGLSPKATEKDLYDFFSFSGAIEHVDIVRSGDHACTAYVTFKDAHSQETAVLLSGATILDQRVCITRWGHYEDEFDFWNRPSQRHEDETESSQPSQRSPLVEDAGEAVAMAQEVVKTMLTKGYVLGKDALRQAKAFDESHQVSASAAGKVAELNEKFGLIDKIGAGVEAAKSVDEKYHISETTKSAVSAVINSSYFSKGALWLSGALNQAAQAAADLGSRDGKQ
ncbi:hypothetical protein QYF36_005690 [Acer negundo]|nr:hypothetical protein QYF36_005690 [Acer negundo]